MRASLLLSTLKGRRGSILVLSLAMLTCALGSGQTCVPGGRDSFIISMITCSDQKLTLNPLTMAQVGSNLYLTYWVFDDGSPRLAFSKDNGKNLSLVYFTFDPSLPKFTDAMTIAAYKGKLYGTSIASGTDLGISLFRIDLIDSGDGSEEATQPVTLGRSMHRTDTTPTLSSTKDALLMAWQSRNDPPRLGFSKFNLPSDPNADILGSTAVEYPQFVAKTRPSIAVIENKRMIYVAFEADNWTTQVVAFSEDDGKVKGQYQTKPGYLVPSIAAFGDRLFLVYCWKQGIGLNFTEVMLNPDGTPKQFNPIKCRSQQFGPADLISTPAGLLMAWRWTKGSQELRIGPVDQDLRVGPDCPYLPY